MIGLGMLFRQAVRLITRLHLLAISCGSWLTIMTAQPVSLATSTRSRLTSLAVTGSSRDVGSSASKTGAPPAVAQAIATR